MEWQTKAREGLETMLREAEWEWTARERTAREAAREQLAEWLNQGLRRLRQAADALAAASITVELASAYSTRNAVFLFRDQALLEAAEMRGLGQLPLVFHPNEAAAFRAAVETKDPVVAIGTASEVSPELAARLDQEAAERVFLYPLPARNGVNGVLFASGVEQPAILEVVAGVASLAIDLLDARPAARRADLVEIAGAVKPDETTPQVRSWGDLTPGEQAIHLKAQRFARRKVAEMRLDYPAKVEAGLDRRDLYAELREPIDLSREEFRREFVEASPTMVDYLYLEMVRSLARDDDHLLGAQFPGRLV